MLPELLAKRVNRIFKRKGLAIPAFIAIPAGFIWDIWNFAGHASTFDWVRTTWKGWKVQSPPSPHPASVSLAHNFYIPLFMVLGGLLWLGVVALWPERKRKEKDTADALNEPISENDPKVLLEYQWQNDNGSGFADVMSMPLELHNDGSETAVNVKVEDIHSGPWLAKFDLQPHLRKGKPATLQATVSYNDLKIPSVKHNFQSMLHPLGGIQGNKVTPATVSYANIGGQRFVSEYEFRWDQEKQEAKAVLVRYGRPKPNASLGNDEKCAPDVFLEWDIPEQHRKLLGMKKQITAVNRSTTDYVYNVVISPLTLAGTLEFPKINELAPKQQIIMEPSIKGMPSVYEPLASFFSADDNYRAAKALGYIRENEKGVAQYTFMVPLTITYSGKGQYSMSVRFYFDTWSGGAFELLSCVRFN